MNKQISFLITMVGFITNNVVLTANATKEIPIIQKIIENIYPDAFKNPVLQITDETIITDVGMDRRSKPSLFPHSFEGLEDEWQVIVCARSRGKQKQIIVNPYTHFNANTLCCRSQKKTPKIFTIKQLKKAEALYKKQHESQ